MGVEAPIELGRQLLPLEELTLNVYFRVALHFGDVMDAVSDLLTDELTNSVVDGQTHTGSLQSHLHSYVQTSQTFYVPPACLPGGLYLSLSFIICPIAMTYIRSMGL